MKKTGILTAVALVMGMGVTLAGEMVPNSLADAAVGEWALYTVPNGYQQRFTVIERDGDDAEATVTVQIDTIYDDEVVSTAFYSDTAGVAMTEAEAPGGGKVARVEQEKFGIKDQNFNATVVKIVPEDPDDESTDWWVAAEVPVFGLLKRVEDGETTMELIDFGKNE